MKIKYTMLLAAIAVAGAGCQLPVKEGKQPVCHKGKTIYVDEAAVSAHIKHGDYGRACYVEDKKKSK